MVTVVFVIFDIRALWRGPDV